MDVGKIDLPVVDRRHLAVADEDVVATPLTTPLNVNVGFLGAQAVNGTIDLHASASVGFTDPTPGDNRITSDDLSDNLDDLATLNTVTATGTVGADFPIVVR